MVEDGAHSEVGLASESVGEHQLREAVPDGVGHDAIVVEESADLVHPLLDVEIHRVCLHLVYVDITVQF